MKALIAILLLAMLGLANSNAGDKSPIVIMLENRSKGSANKSIWKMDGKQVYGKELSLALNKLLLGRGRDCPVIIMGLSGRWKRRQAKG